MKLITASIPLFFILIGIELLASRLLERRVYRFADTFADLGCGMLEQLLGVFVKVSLFAAYLGLYDRVRLFDLPEHSWLVIAVCFIGTDFLYYWFHRMSHETGAMWAAHSVHHQSEEYNLAVALRQGAFQSFFSWVFYLPLAVLGFPPATFITCSALNTLYQFWIHTRLIGKLGPLEWVFNTPSHHRVHHGRNPRYIDRNHAGVLIVWDRLFGTFVPETEEPVYGVVKPLASSNPLWANFATWADLFGISAKSGGVTGRLRPFWAPPGWRPRELGGPLEPKEVSRPADEPADDSTPRSLAAYVLVNFLLLLLVTAATLTRASTLDTWALLAVALNVGFGLVVLSGLLEARPWGRAAEVTRVLLALGLGGAIFSGVIGAGFDGLFFGNP